MKRIWIVNEKREKLKIYFKINDKKQKSLKKIKIFLSNANRQNHKIAAKFMTINKMNEIQKSNFSKNFQNDFINTWKPHDKQFRKKTKILKNSFFLFSFDADTENIQKFIYAEFEICPLTVIKTKIRKIIRRFKIDKIANSNDVSNKILQIFFETLIDVLISLYQICVNIKYHPITFKKINTMIFKKLNKKITLFSTCINE